MSGVLDCLLHHRRRQLGLATVGFCLHVAFHRTRLHRIETGDRTTDRADGGHDPIIPRAGSEASADPPRHPPSTGH